MNNVDKPQVPSDASDLTPKGTGACTSLVANPVMSRRSFFSLAAVVGALTFLGSAFTPGGTMVTAWADEEGKIHFTIYILGADELPILCYTLDSDDKQPVQDMVVTIQSLNNKEKVVGTTNEQGYAIVHIRELSQQANDKTARSYSFFGSVEAKKSGYRNFYVPETYLCTGVPASSDGGHPNALEIPAHAISDGDIYLCTAALDNEDVQYCSADCSVGSDNTIEHTFDVEVIAPSDKAVDVTVLLVAPDRTQTIWGQKTVYDTDIAPGSYVASFSGTWLKDAQIGSMLKVKFGLHGETPLVMTSQVQFVAPKEGLSTAFGDKNISPGQDSDKTPDTSPIPDWIIATGDVFTCAFPQLPIKIFSDNKGNFGITATLLQITFLKNRNGENKLEDADKVRHIFGGWGMDKAWNGYKNEVGAAVDRFGSCLDDALAHNSSFGSTPLTRKIDSSFQLQLMGYFSWQPDAETGDHFWRGDLAIAVDLGVSCSWTKQCIYVIPFYFVVDLSANVNARMIFGLKFGGEFEHVKWGRSTGGAPFAITVVLHAEVGFAIAVGISGIAGLGIRGSGYLHFEFVFDDVKNKPNPHITGKLAARAEAFVEVLFFKKTWTITDTPVWKIVDNWENTVSSLESRMDAMTRSMTYSPMSLEDATLVTDDELAFCADYTAVMTPVTSDTMQALELDPDAPNNPDYILEYTPIQKDGVGMYAMGTDADEDPAFYDPYNESGATTYNPHRGLKPTKVVKLFPDAYSNSRLKVTHGYTGYTEGTGGGEDSVVAARLVTAVITDSEGAKHSVTRVALATWNFTTHSFNAEQIVEFNVEGVNAVDRYDVDFDFDLSPSEYEGDVAFMAITSVVRPEDETYDAYEKQQFVTCTTWYVDQNAAWNQAYNRSFTLRGLLDKGYATSGPRVLLQSVLGKFNMVNNPAAVYLYYYKTNVDTGNTTLNVTSMGFYSDDIVVDDQVLLSEFPGGLTSADLRHGSFEVYTPTRIESVISGNNYTTNLALGWRGCNSSLATPEGMGDADTGAPYSFLRAAQITLAEDGAITVTITDSLNLPNVASLSRRTVQDGMNAPFVYHEDTSKQKKKPYILVKLDESALTFSTKAAEGATRLGNYFASHDGKWLYTVREVNHEVPGLSDHAQEAKEAGGVVYADVYQDDDSNSNLGDVPMTGGQLTSYQLLEARWYDKLDSYYEFYPIAQLDFCPDNIDAIDHQDGRRDFLFSTISAVDKNDSTVRYDLADSYDMDQVYHVSDLYQVTVPNALGLHVKGLEVATPFANIGDKAFLVVELVNTGNWFITGFEVEFYLDGQDSAFETTVFSDLENRVLDTHENYKTVLDADGNPQYGDNGQMVSEKTESRFDALGMLAPGSTRKYRIEFTVPDGVTGETDFSLRVQNPRCEASDARSEWILESDYQVESTLAYVDPNVHGVPGTGASSLAHFWQFKSNDAPYAIDGEDPQPLARGDVNGNGKVNIVDAQLAYDIATDNEALKNADSYEDMKARADVNNDDVVDSLDAFAIQNAIHNGWD